MFTEGELPSFHSRCGNRWFGGDFGISSCVIDSTGDRAGIMFAFVLSAAGTIVLTQLRPVAPDTIDVNI
ncbi:MAG: hypothetical protein ACI81L_002911 [Verrucomicrobiales bacterium]